MVVDKVKRMDRSEGRRKAAVRECGADGVEERFETKLSERVLMRGVREDDGDGGALPANDVEEEVGPLLLGVVGIKALKEADEEELEAHNGTEDCLARLALAPHHRSLRVTSGGLNVDLEILIAVGVSRIDGACGVDGFRVEG